jgi:hypothetical protein
MITSITSHNNPVDSSPGLCADCQFAAVIRSDRGSVFYQCRLSFTNAAFPKYPRLPVLQCSGYCRSDARNFEGADDPES